MGNYLLKSGIIISVFYLFYVLFIKRETFFQLNRFYLLATLIFALILPLLPVIHYKESSTIVSYFIGGVSITENLEGIKNSKYTGLINPLSIIYLGGVSWFTVRFISSLGRLLFIYRRFPKTTVNGLKAVIMNGDLAPFTFFNILFITETDLNRNEQNGIIEHELTHVRQYHSLDLFILELGCIIQWFNPFIWLYKVALKTEHEYTADEQVVKEGYNKLAYQELLFEKTMGVTALGLTNNFNFSLLKNRIKMMTKNRSKANARLKYLLSIPMILLVLTFSMVDCSIASSPDDTVYDEVDVMPEYPGGIQEVRKYIAQNLTYPEIAAEQGVAGRIFVQFTVYENGSVQDVIIMRSDINTKVGDEIVVVGYERGEAKNASSQKEEIIALENEAVRVVKTIPDFTPGLKDGKPVKVRFTFPIQFALQAKPKSK